VDGNDGVLEGDDDETNGVGLFASGWSLWLCGWVFAQPGELRFPELVFPQVFVPSSPIHTPGGPQFPPRS